MSSPASIPASDVYDSATDHGPVHVHVMSPMVLLAVYAALMIATFATVAVTKFDLGSLNIWVALAIALVKASLVVLYFMHLRYDSPFNAVIFITSLFFVALFMAVALQDSHLYQRNYEPPGVHQVMGSQDGV